MAWASCILPPSTTDGVVPLSFVSFAVVPRKERCGNIWVAVAVGQPSGDISRDGQREKHQLL